MISLIPYALKSLIKITYGRIKRASDENVTEDQFGCRHNTGTNEAHEKNKESIQLLLTR